jgi:hydrogenase maturation protease HycI
MNLQEQLATRIHGNVVIVGIGNPCRGDDAAGSLVARQISDVPDARIIDAQDVPEDYLSQVVRQRPDSIVLIDSVDLDSEPGSIALLDKDQVADYWPSTHRVPICLLMNYFERETHARIFLIGIQPRQTGFLGPVSEEVSSSVVRIADALRRVLATPRTLAPVGFTAPGRGRMPA